MLLLWSIYPELGRILYAKGSVTRGRVFSMQLGFMFWQIFLWLFSHPPFSKMLSESVMRGVVALHTQYYWKVLWKLAAVWLAWVNTHVSALIRSLDVLALLLGMLDDLYKLNLTSMEWDSVNGNLRGSQPSSTAFFGVASDDERLLSTTPAAEQYFTASPAIFSICAQCVGLRHNQAFCKVQKFSLWSHVI